MVILSLGSDYQRVLRAVFAIAEIRLLRTYGWTPDDGGSGLPVDVSGDA